MKIYNWFKKHFTYSYEVVTRTVTGKQKIQVAINEVAKGKGHHRIITKLRFPWQHPDTQHRGVVLLFPGEHRESIVISKDYTTLYGSEPKQSKIILPYGCKVVITIESGKAVMIRELYIQIGEE